MKTLGFLMVALLSSAPGLRAADPIIVHEWGTFTCLQDDHGNAIGGINVDDEPVPDFVYGSGFVHALAGGASARVCNFGLPPYGISKGWVPADHDVTMRLETPVIYFYPPAGVEGTGPPPLQVHVEFQGGVLSQEYPYAKPGGWDGTNPSSGQKLVDIRSSLDWQNVLLVSHEKPVETSDKVWTTPREVSAPVLEVNAQVYNGHGGFDTKPQAEHFLFYRGVGHVDSPILLGLLPNNSGTAEMGVWAATNDMMTGKPLPFWDTALEAYYTNSWLVNVRADGATAFRALAPFGGPRDQTVTTNITQFDSRFGPSDFGSQNINKLKSSMHAVLVKEGLYDDEATAMLKTWELSYFKSPGLRFFYVVPRAWTDKELPLTITGAPTQITRVMIGRIELISDEQKATLARLASGPPIDLNAVREAADKAMVAQKLTDQQKSAFYTAARPLSDLGIAIPPAVLDYLSLGRFRDALIVHEQQEHPSDNFARFIKENGLATGETGYHTISVTNSPPKEP